MSGFGLWGPASVSQAVTPLGDSTFEIDDNADLTPSTGIDWLATAGGALQPTMQRKDDDPTGGSDNSFATGTKENSLVPDVGAGSIPNNKSDLKSFGLYEEHTATSVFLNVFWTRLLDPNGTTNMDFEFNQASAVKNDPVGSPQIIPVRTPGDLLVTYDLAKGGTVPTLSKRVWSGAVWGPETALTGQAIGSINSSAILAANSGGATGLGDLSAFTFGEASLDLLALVPQSSGCRTFGSVYLKSRSSDAFTSDLKDFIKPLVSSISNCGTITLHKTDTVAGTARPLPLAVFKLYQDAGGGALGTLVDTQTTDTSGNLTFSNVPKGNYVVVEDVAPAGHTALANTLVSITAGDQTVPLNLDDPFSPRQDLGVSVTANGSHSRDDLWTLGKTANKTKVNVASGGTATFDYTVTATPNGSTTSGYALTGAVTVTNPNPLDDITADISVGAAVGGGASCTVTNGLGVTVPKKTGGVDGSVTRNYSCTFTGTPAPGNVTATVSWDGTAAHTPHSSAQNTAAATFTTLLGETHGTVTVVDDKTDPAHPVTLGTASWASGPTAFTYSLTKSGVAGTCTDYTNTAVISQTNQTASKTVTVCVGADLTVTKTAVTAQHRIYLWDITKDVDKTTRNVAAGGSAAFTYTVTATPAGTTDDGWSTTGQISVTNPNDWEDVPVDVTDTVNVGGGASCTVAGSTHVTVKALSTSNLSYSCTYTGVPGNGTNTATATWDATAASTPHSSATGTASVVFQPTSKTNETITVVDDKTDPAHPVTLGTATYGGGAKAFTYTLSLPGVGGACTGYTNTAKIAETGQTARKTATVCAGSPLTAGVSSTATFGRNDLWSISKDVNATKVTTVGNGAVSFTYTVRATPSGFADNSYALSGAATVTNPNAWEAVTAAVSVTTTVDPAATCTVVGGAAVSVPAGSTVTLPFSCALTGTPALVGTVTAAVTWDRVAAATSTGSASATGAVAFAKVAETHSTVTVVDDMTDPAHPVTLGTATWAAGPTVFTYTLSKTAVAGTCRSWTNNAAIVETGQGASKQVTVCGGQALTVGATARGSYDQDDHWTIGKDVDHTSLTAAAGDKVTFHYTVTATANGSTKSGYTLGGDVTVANPNDWEAVTTDVSVTTDLDPAATCTVTGGTSVPVPASGSATLHYTCTFPAAPTLTGTVTATATWDPAAAFTSTGTASHASPVTLGLGTESHKTVTVVDDKTDPANPVTLGTADWANGATAFTYALDKTAPSATCASWTNTAVIAETRQSTSKTVRACGGAALTASVSSQGAFGQQSLWTISKSVDRTSVTTTPGGTVTFHYTVTASPAGRSTGGHALSGAVSVTNPNDWESVASSVAVTTDVDPGATCTVTGPAVTVPASGTVSLPYSCAFASTPKTTGTVTATVTWDPAAASTAKGSAAGSSGVTFVATTSTNDTVTVVDDKTDPAHPVTLGTASWTAGPATFTYAVDQQGTGGTCRSYTNTAAIVQTAQSAQQTVRVCAGDPLAVDLTADGTFDRDDLWTITKDVDQTTRTTASGGTVTFRYTVTAAPNGFTDSGHALGGDVTVANPNDWEAVTTDVSVTTDLDPAATCTVTGGTGAAVPAKGAVTLPYTCAFTGTPALSGNVVATATWDPVAAATATGTTSGTKSVALTKTGEAHSTVTVVDDKTDPAHPVTLGTATWADGDKTFTYDLDKTVGDGCVTYTNTASLTETGQTASQDVAACGEFTGGGGTVTPPVTPPTVTPPTGGGGTLTFTGAYTSAMAQWALAALAGGLLLLVLGRRRRTS